MTLHRPDVQTLPREKLRALQQERLRAVVTRALEQPVPFFARKLASAGLGPDDVKTLDDLRAVPRTVKQELRSSEAATPPLGDYRGAPRERCIRLSTSSGTTGRPTIMLFTGHDLQVEYDAAGRMFARQGYRPGEVITHAHPAGLNGGAALLGGAIEAYGCCNVPVGPPTTKADAEAAIRLWLELKPDRYEMFGPALHLFWETAQSMGIDPATDLRMQPPADVVPWRTVSAGIDCFAFLGSACEHANGAHVCEDEAIVEAVDPRSGEPVPDGARGHLVVTTLTKDNFMLRYDLEDLIRIDRSPCQCGETHMRVFWDGRAADVVTAGGREVLPIDVQVVLSRFPEIASPALEFQLVRRRSSPALEVRAEAASPNDTLRDAAAAALQDALGVAVSLALVSSGALPRPAYKPLRVVDE